MGLSFSKKLIPLSISIEFGIFYSISYKNCKLLHVIWVRSISFCIKFGLYAICLASNQKCNYLLSVLEILESLVLGKLTTNPNETSDQNYGEIIAIAQAEQKKIKNKLAETLFLTDESRFEFYIHKVQNDITHLLDQLYNFLDSEETILSIAQNSPLSFKDLQISVYYILEDMLDYIESQFPKYFNLEAAIPNRKRVIAIRQFSDNLEDLYKYQDLIPSKLLVITALPIKNFIKDPSSSTYRCYYYLKRYMMEISNFRNSEIHRVDLSYYIIRKLIRLNFNTVTFFNFITIEISKNVNQLEIVSEKIDQLSWYLKEVNQTLVIPDIGYIPHQRPIKGLLSEWIIEEIDHLDKSLHKSLTQAQIVKNKIDENFKIQTDLSVPQYAFLLRTFVETGLFKNKDQDKALTKLFALITKTKGAENISPESLRKLFYKDDEKVREVVKTAIIKMLNYIQTLNILLILLNTCLTDFPTIVDTMITNA
jgi:hypothetical protein